jgi:hypothetical protein
MTLQILPDLEQRSEEWFAQRRGMVTASAVGQLVIRRFLTAIDYDCPNCHAAANNPCLSKTNPAPIKTLHSERAAVAKKERRAPVIEPASNTESRALTAQLVAERIAGWTDQTFMSDDMWRGVVDEPKAVAKYVEHYGCAVTAVGFMVQTFPSGHRLGYSPDGLVEDEGLLEVKCPRAKTHIATILANEVPTAHMGQCQAGLLVSGRKWLDFISYCGGLPMFVKRVYPDPKWFDAITEALRIFEETAAVNLALYETATQGLAQTERSIDLEMVI